MSNQIKYLSIIRATNVKYARKLYKEGSIKFGTPIEWVKYAEESTNEGRGDLLEGVFASAKLGNHNDNAYHNKKYEDVSVKYSRQNRLNYFRKNSSMFLPTYCFYILTTGEFSEKTVEGEISFKKHIPPDYFKDFADYRTPEEMVTIEEDKRPALVWIEKQDEFISRIFEELLNIGVKKEEIIYTAITYKDLKREFEHHVYPPNELAFKDIRFKNQSEARIIVNTKNTDILKYLYENPVSIGDISDISQKLEKYMYDGADIEFFLKDTVRG